MTIIWQDREYDLDEVGPNDYEIVLYGDDEQITIPIERLISRAENILWANGITVRGWDDENWTTEFPDEEMEAVMNDLLEDYVIKQLEDGNFKREIW